MKLSQDLKELAGVMMESYVTLFSDGGKSNMPYTQFQMQWQKYVSTFILDDIDECNAHSLSLRERLVDVAGLNPTLDVRSN